MRQNVIEFTRASDLPDADFSHLRGGDVLRKLVRRYPSAAPNLQRAHELLRDEANYARAMHRVANSLQEGCIRVFISYRLAVDAEAARAVAEIIRVLSRQRAVVTFADEFTSRISGQDYKSEIESATKAAHWFVILISEMAEPSGWSMYETGMFRASTTSRRIERLICLHHPSAALPSAIDGFQSVSSDEGRLQSFLDGLFRQPDPLPGWDALNPTLEDATIREAAAKIAQVLRPPRKPVTFNYNLTLEVPDPARISAPADLAQCGIEADSKTANLFGKVEAPGTWGELTASLNAGGQAGQWLVELVAVMRKAAAGDLFRPITGAFECAQGGRMMRPVLHAMEYDGVGSDFRFHIVFLDEFSSPAVHGIAPRTRALVVAVRMHNRVRWEILERFSGTRWPHDDIETCAKVFSRIDRETRAQGGIDGSGLCSHYSGPAAGEMQDLVEDWESLLDASSGRLSRALREFDVDAIARGITQCRDLNRRFFELTYPVLEDIARKNG